MWEPLAGEIEGRWRERFGEHDVARLREALEHALRDPGPELPRHLPIVGYGLGSEVVPAPDQALAGGRTPYATATARLLADPRAALPHHPLMLHRGGFPDGS